MPAGHSSSLGCRVPACITCTLKANKFVQACDMRHVLNDGHSNTQVVWQPRKFFQSTDYYVQHAGVSAAGKNQALEKVLPATPSFFPATTGRFFLPSLRCSEDCCAASYPHTAGRWTPDQPTLACARCGFLSRHTWRATYAEEELRWAISRLLAGGRLGSVALTEGCLPVV